MSRIDLIVGPFILILLIITMSLIKSRLTNSETRSFFIWGFWTKIFGALAFALVYQFYYGYGDTFMYFDGITILHDLAYNDPFKLIELLRTEANDAASYLNSTGKVNRIFYLGEAEYAVMKVGVFYSLITFKSYLGISFLFAFTSFIGVWLIFTVAANMYPTIKKKLALAVLFYPSIAFWGSGLLKDSIAVGGMGFAFYAMYYLFIEKFRLLNIRLWLLLIVSVSVVLMIKGYIAMLLIPCMILWKYLRIQKRLSLTYKMIFTPFLLAIGGVGIYFSLFNLVESESRFSVDNIANTAAYQAYHIQNENAGSSYDIGVFDGSIGSLISYGPKAIFITMFRPFMWETTNPIMFISAFENFLVLFFFTYGFIKIGFFNYFKGISFSPFITFCFVFSIVLALFVGLTSGNYGTLVRYKVPMLPFFAILLMVMYYHKKITPESLKQ